MTECDIIIVGGGPAGYTAALAAAHLGQKVVLCDRTVPGGTCLHRGCIPTKALVGAARRWRFARGAAAFGLPVPQGEPDCAALMAAGRKSITILAQGLQQQLTRAGVAILRGDARITSQCTVFVRTDDGEAALMATAGIILAPGSKPALLPGLEPDGERVVDSDSVWQWTRLPRTLLVVGGGVIGCEFASALTALGTKVTVVEAAPALLGGFDADLATGLLRCFKKDGITILAGTTVSGLVRSASGVTVQLAGLNSGDWSGDAVLVAAGRVPALDGLIGADFGLTLNARGGLTVDEHLQTTAAGVYAAGDAVGGLQLAHAAAEMGEIAVFNLLGGKRVFAPGNIPWAMFTEPEAGSVGLGEQQARAQGLPVCCGKVPVRTLGRAHATGEIEGLCKVVANRDDGRLLGVHLLGGRATDLIAAGALALQAQLTVSQLADAVQAHPTFAEGLREAAREALRHRNDG